MHLTAWPACIKYLLFVFNLIFVVTGIAVLSVGSVIQGVYYDYERFLDDGYYSAPALLIAIGIIVLIVSFFGCCGAIKENHCMILTFSVLLMAVFILELAGGIAGYVLRARAEEIISSRMNETMTHYNTSTPIAELWDGMQSHFHCCGVKNATDWYAPLHGDHIPLSCCAPKSGTLDIYNCNATTAFNEGCLKALGEYVQDHAITLGGVGVGIAFIQLLGVALACYLAWHIRKNYEAV